MPQAARTLSEPEFDAIKAKILDAAPKGLKEDEFNRYIGPAMAQAIGEAENSAKPLDGSAIARFASGAWKNLNPMGLVSAIYHPIATLGEIASSSSDRSAAAVKALKEGRYADAATNAVGAVPLVGPPLVSAGERIGSGDIAGGLGETAGIIGGVESPRLVKGSVSGVNRAATGLATSVGAQHALGVIGGGAVGAEIGHPFLGTMVGAKYGGPIIRTAAERVEGLTGGRKNVPFNELPLELQRDLLPDTAAPERGRFPGPPLRDTPEAIAASRPSSVTRTPAASQAPSATTPAAEPAFPGLTAAKKAELRRLRYPEAAIAVIDQKLRSGEFTTGEDATPPTPSAEPSTPPASKLTLTANEARIGLQMVKAGKTTDEALAHILALREAP